MTVTIIVDGEVWLQHKGVTDITLREGSLCIYWGKEEYLREISVDKIQEMIVTSY